MKEIGGYFALEGFCYKSSFADKSLMGLGYAVNSCRNALLLWLQHNNIKTIYLPFYTCGVLEDVLKSQCITIKHYSINDILEIKDISIPKEAHIIYTNYFGIKDEYIQKLINLYPNLIVDNAQALFSLPVTGVPTIYSPRKFLGVPDGGFLSTSETLNLDNYKEGNSHDRCSHLLKRIELSALEGYQNFIENDQSLEGEPLYKMSQLTKVLLAKVNIPEVKCQRIANFDYLHNKLKGINQLKGMHKIQSTAALVYPLLLENGASLKKLLIAQNIYVATYWPDVLERVEQQSFEAYLTKNLVALPIDHRYGIEEMKIIANIILQWK